MISKLKMKRKEGLESWNVAFLVISDRDPRMIAHIVYEAKRLFLEDPKITNRVLLKRIMPYLRMMTKRSILSDIKQTGLMGELDLLEKIISFKGVEFDEVSLLEHWRGSEGGLRDFSFAGCFVEVKSTLKNRRIHLISQMDQFDSNEKIYLYSTMWEKRLTDEGVRLIDCIKKIDLKFKKDEARNAFRQKIEEAGIPFDVEVGEYCDSDIYKLEPSFVISQPGRMYRIDSEADILRKTSFKQDKPPHSVEGISYELNLETEDFERRVVEIDDFFKDYLETLSSK